MNSDFPAGEGLLWVATGGRRERGALRSRLRAAARLLRGHPVAYRLMVDPRGIAVDPSENPTLMGNRFCGGTSIIVFDSVTGQAERLDLPEG